MITPLRAIRLKCLDCSGMSAKEVKLCHLWECPLWQYRMGSDRSPSGRLLNGPNGWTWISSGSSKSPALVAGFLGVAGRVSGSFAREAEKPQVARDFLGVRVKEGRSTFRPSLRKKRP